MTPYIPRLSIYRIRFFFFQDLRTEHPTETQNIKAINYARKLFDHVKSNLSDNERWLEENFIKKKLSVTF